MDKKLGTAVIVLLVISLGLNVYSVTRLHKVQQEVEVLRQVTSGLEQSENSLRGTLHSLQSRLDRIREAQRWITPAEVDVGPERGDARVARISWQVKEYSGGAPVSFFYREQGEEDFKELAANHRGGGLFQVELEVPYEPDPSIDMEFKQETASGSQNRAVEIAQNTGNPSEYIYYVSMREGEKVRTSEKRRLSLSKISRLAVSPLKLEVTTGPGAKEFTLALYENSPREPELKLTSAAAGIYSGDKKLKGVQLKRGEEKIPADRAVPVFRGSLETAEMEADSLRLELQYDSGDTVVKEIPRALHYMAEQRHIN